mgnify:CR=1 FL=1
MEHIELLSPAKNLEIGKAAIDCGADAVYIGADNFGARVQAGNSLEDIASLVSYAHLFNAKVYVTINTILFDNELKATEDLIHKLYAIKVDAIIIQDYGILEMNLPPINIHSSTQMHNISKERIKFLKDVGFSRVVLARELSIEDIKEIHSYVPDIELEFFVHGALCNGLSGQCYLSYEITNRSGNRGECSQPCRSRYDLVNSQGKILVKDKHILSTKDFNASLYIPEMIEAGVRSFKIEGRLKDLEYVKNVTAHYSKEIDNFINTGNNKEKYCRSSIGKTEIGFEPDVERSFNRGFTSFNLNGKKDIIGNLDSAKSIGKYIGKVSDINRSGRGKFYFQVDTKERFSNGDGLCFISMDGNIEGFLVNGVEENPSQGLVMIYPNKKPDIKLLTKIYRNLDTQFSKQVLSDKSKRKIAIDITLSETPQGFSLQAIDEQGLKVQEDIITEKQIALKTQDYQNNLLKQIDKFGDSIFYLRSFENKCSNNFFFASSLLNQHRRNLIEKLYELRQEAYKPIQKEFEKTTIPYPQKTLDFRANIVNEKAKEFYTRHKVEDIEYGLEKENSKNSKPNEMVLMRTKNCIRYTLGQCLIRDKQTPDFDQELFLKDNQRTYKLHFDCKNCFMDILLLE